MQIGISVLQKRDFGRNTSIYECDKTKLTIMVLAFNKGGYKIREFILYSRVLHM